MSAVADIATEMPDPILFTDSAASKVAELIAEMAERLGGSASVAMRRWIAGQKPSDS